MSRRRKIAKKHAEPVEAPPRLTAPIGLALVLMLAFLVYLPSLNGTRLWDDDGHITRPELQSFHGLYRIWTELTATQQYYPLLHSAFWLEHKLWGDSVLGYHLVNLLWHLCAVSLLYLILVRLKVPGALLAAAIFAVHPVMVESVAWISEQKNTLSAVFYLSAMLVYLGFDESRLRFRYFIALGLFALGLLTKTITATLPAALLVIFWWQRGTLSWKRDVLPLVPFFVLGAMSGVLTAWIERALIGAEGAGFEMTIAERCLLAGRVIWFYLGKLVWPINLMFFYPRWTLDPTVWWQWLFPIAALAVLVSLWALRRRSRAPLAGWLLFVGTLFPVLGFLNVFPFIFSFVADHFQYLASLGMITLVAAGTAQCISRLEIVGRFVTSFLCVIVVGTLAMLSFQQSKMYSDIFTLYRTTLARNPECWMACNNLGELLAKTNREDAMAYYQAALRLRPEYPEALNNVGFELMQSGRNQEAIEYLEHAVRVNPKYSEARNNLGIAFFNSGKVPEATEQFRLAVEINPKSANAQSSYGKVLSGAGDLDEAIVHYKEAVRLRPNFAEIHQRLGEIFGHREQFQEAIEHFQAALQYKPDVVDIYADLAIAFASVNQPQQAMATARKGIETAHFMHQDAAAERLEDWLRHYQTELQRAGRIIHTEMTKSAQCVLQRSEGATPLDAGPRRSAEWIGLALVLVATFVVYWPAARGTMVFDDEFYLTRPDLQSADGLYRIWFDPMATAQYYPLVHTAFWVEHKLWGDNYLGYHLANVFWHGLAVLLVYMILVKLKIPGALLAAAIFALHPVIVESVAWMTEQKNTLSAVFYLSATLAYLEFDTSRRRSRYFVALILFAAALFTKTATVSLPVALLIIFWWQRGSLSWWRDVWPLIPFFALGISAGLMTVWVERMHGAQGVDFDLSFFERTLIAGRAIWFYLAKLLWPSNLTFIYPRCAPDTSQWWQWIFPVAALATTGTFWAIRNRSQAPLAAWLYFCATLFPVLGFLNVYYFTYSFVADHFQYLASLGIITLVAAGISQGLAYLEKPAPYVGEALCVVLLAILAALSLQQSPMYADIATLYKSTIERNPECWLAHNNLGTVLDDAGNEADAMAHYRSAIRIKPDYAGAHNNLANALNRAGRLPEALKEFRIAISLDARDPKYHSNLASALVKLGQYPEAIEHCQEALRLQKDYFDARLALGTALLHSGRLREAVEEIRSAQALRPDDPIVCNTLGAVLLQVGQVPEASQQFEHALQLQPKYPDARNNLAHALARSGQISQAIEQFHQAIAIDDKYSPAHIGLGLILDAQGKYDDAIEQFEKAIQVGANQPDVHNHLGESLRKSGQINPAIEHYQTAVRLKPDFMPACANLAQTLALANRSQEAIAVSEKSIELARSTGQQEALEQFEDWLKHYRTELRRAEEAAALAPQSPTKP